MTSDTQWPEVDVNLEEPEPGDEHARHDDHAREQPGGVPPSVEDAAPSAAAVTPPAPTGTHKSERIPVVTSALNAIAELPGVDVGAVYARASTKKDYRDLKARTYLDLVQMIDDRLTTAGELGMIIMDGDGTDLPGGTPRALAQQPEPDRGPALPQQQPQPVGADG